jgi:phosphate-selective porin
MKRLFALFLVFSAFLILGQAGAWAKDKSTAGEAAPAATTDDAEDADDPSAVSVSDLENLSNKISDLAKSAKVTLLLQAQYINTGFNPLLPKGFSSPTKVSVESGKAYNDLFLGKRAEISLTGDLAEKKISYKVQYDPLATTTAKAGVSNGEQLKDYWIKASYIPFADLQFGQFKYAQALEGRTPSGELDFANTAFITTALEARRDLAFQVSGSKIPVGPVGVEYAVALVQGSGQNAGADNNDSKDFAGRLGLTLADPDWNAYVGATGYIGTEIDNAAAPVPASLLLKGWDRTNSGFETRVTVGGLKLQGEYIQGELEPGNNYNPWTGTTAANARESNPQGWYATASYRYQDLRLGVRGESYTPDTTPNSPFNKKSDILTVGLDWFQGKDKFKLSANYEKHFSQYDAFITQAQINL